jgi:hypothetical protein
MKSVLTAITFGTFAIFVAPLRRLRAPRAARPAIPPAARPTARAAGMDAATYAAMMAEAERIAAPYRRHIASLRAPEPAPVEEELGGDFPEVESLLARAGLLAR